ncbi:MAG TPA: hypothetical protein VK995_01930 [Oceanipulchritudo sp.]|nr:hypothetical protein [Oceanipulchritudo sp.]
MGWLYVAYAPWVWCQKTQCWYYIREEVAVADRGWLYAPDLAAMEVYPATGYAWSYKMSKWIYIEPSGSGWFYML